MKRETLRRRILRLYTAGTTMAVKYPILWGWIIGPIIGVGCVCFFPPGCSTPPYAASTNQTLPGEDTEFKPVLDRQDQAEINRSFAEMAKGHQIAQKPEPARRGARWSDVPLAAVYACDNCEMAISRTRETATRFEFEIRTVEGHPGVLIVERGGQDVYSSRATIGVFGDRHDRAEQLRKAFDIQMKRFGEKRQYRKD